MSEQNPKRSIVLATSHLQPFVEIAKAAEAAGFYRIWTTEGSGGDAVARAQYLAANTSRIRVATGIAYAFAKPPLSMAVLAADVQAMSGGRFALGLGAGTRGVRERRYSSMFDHPGPRMAEYIQLVRTILNTRGGLKFTGRFYEIDFPQFELPHDPALSASIELYGAALNPIMTRHMAAACDGVAMHSLALFSPFFEDVTVPNLRKGAEKQGKMPRIAAWKITVADADEERARHFARRQLAFYFSTPSYGPILAGTPWEAAGAAVREESRRVQYRDWDAVTKFIPDDMVDGLTIAGTPPQVADKLAAVERRLAPSGVDEMVLQIVQGTNHEETRANVLAVIAAASPNRAA
jgi:probable F420-dependent oxidoreductase